MKTRKNWLSTTLLFAALLMAPAISSAGYGMGPGNGTGTCLNIYNGTPVTIAGVVTSVVTGGQGISIDTGTEVVTVYGLGPIRYWNSLGVARPQVGERVEITAYSTTFSDGTSRTIATAVNINGDTVQLRDPDTGMPLWRGGGMRGRMNR